MSISFPYCPQTRRETATSKQRNSGPCRLLEHVERRMSDRYVQRAANWPGAKIAETTIFGRKVRAGNCPQGPKRQRGKGRSQIWGPWVGLSQLDINARQCLDEWEKLGVSLGQKRKVTNLLVAQNCTWNYKYPCVLVLSFQVFSWVFPEQSSPVYLCSTPECLRAYGFAKP